MWDVVLDALLDTVKLFPFLFVLYILIEIMEHNTGVGRPVRALSGKFAPLIGGALGTVPMCGFSVMAAKLYKHRHITLGTLFAVFLTTSDEGLIVLLFSGLPLLEKLVTVALLIGIRFLLGIGIAYLLDAALRRKPLPIPVHDHKEGDHVRDLASENAEEPHLDPHEHDGSGSYSEHGHTHEHPHAHEHGHDGEDEEEHAHGDCACDELSPCEHKHKSKLSLYLVSPLLHALQVAAFVFLVNLAFGLIIYAIGEARFISFMQESAYWVQPLVCALVGAIPNCASSVVLAEVYALGGIGFGGLLAGLTVNAGLGYLILLERKEGLAILGGMLLLGIACGYIACAVLLFI